MKKEITNKDLLNFKKDFDASNLNKLASNSVMRNGVKNSAYNSYIKRELVNQFSIEVKNTGSITNQKQSGRCWIFAGLNVLRGIAMKNLHVKNIEFSESYLMFYDKLEKSNYQLEAVLDNLDETDNSRLMDHIVSLGGQQDGGYWHYFVALVKKYGICPIQAMPETISSSSSSEMDSIISTLITKDTAILRNRYNKELSKGSSKQDAKEKVSKLKENMLEEIYRVLAICLGKPCEEFTFEYQEDDPVKENEQEKKVKSKKESKEKSQFRRLVTTPKEFYDKYISEELSNYVVLVNWPLANYPMNQTYTSKYVYNVVGDKQNIFVNVPIKEIKSALIKSLKDNKISWFACDVLASSLRQDGYLATEILDYDNLFSVKLNFDKGDRMMLRDSLCNHAMTFTGVNLDFRNKPNRWKVQNSWGELAGFKGYYVMSDNWFDEYVYEVVVEKQYLSEEVLKALETTPIELDPWSPVC